MKHFDSLFLLGLTVLACSGTAKYDYDGTSGGHNTDTGDNPVTPAPVTEGALCADGNDEGTYDLILACGYNYETPDQSGDHAESPYRHIRQSYDSELDRYVFDFILHIDNDDDRGLPNIKDRQRNEIKTDAKSPASMVAQQGETLKMTWKFKLPDGMQTTKSFSHIHQLKGIDNSEGTADVANPLITFTVRSMSNGSQEFQVIHTQPSSYGKSNIYLVRVPLDDFLGEWVEVEETVTFDWEGEYSTVIRRVSDGKVLVEVKGESLVLWRDGTTGLRPKWGLYRNFGADGCNKYLLRDECLKFADFMIKKLV